MNKGNIHLFIVNEDHHVLKDLRRYLVNRCGNRVEISTFLSATRVLQKVDMNTSIVVLKYNNVNDSDVLNAIKKINPGTAVIMLPSNEEIGAAIDSFRNGVVDLGMNGKNAVGRILDEIYRIMKFPGRVLMKYVGVRRFVAAFVFAFATMGIVVTIVSAFIG